MNRLMKLVCMMLAALVLGVKMVYAVPACPTPAVVVQPDGTQIEVFLRGDEHSHWHEDSEGYAIVKNSATKRWEYAECTDDGTMYASGYAVGKSCPVRFKAAKSSITRMRSKQIELKSTGSGLERTDAISRTGGVVSGTFKNLVLLVEFSDVPFTYKVSDYQELFNKTGYSLHGAKGSVKDFYKEISYGKVEIESVIAGPVKLSHGYAYYGADKDDAKANCMVQEALDLLEASGFDFSQVDGDGDGWVDAFDLIHSGYGEEYSGNDEDLIWSHKSNLYKLNNDGTLYHPYPGYVTRITKICGGVKFDRYHTEPEFYGWQSDLDSRRITPLGTICHETGHYFGLPDLYDTDYTSSGIGKFCLMAGGSHNNGGLCPAQMSAWCKVTLGWVDPVVLEAADKYSLKRVEDNAQIYKLQGNLPSGEYFLLENRQGVLFDSYLPGSKRGILIWHIDDNQPSNDNEKHYLVDLEEASGTQHLESKDGVSDDADYFRNDTLNAFSPATTPSSDGYTGVSLGFSISDISASGNTMTFTLAKGDGISTSGEITIDADGKCVSPYVFRGTKNVTMKLASSYPKWITSGTIIDSNGNFCSLAPNLGIGFGDVDCSLYLTAAENISAESRTWTLQLINRVTGSVLHSVLVTQRGKEKQYAVGFNANGGTGTMSSQTFKHGVPQELSKNKFTLSGYTFTGWATSATGAVIYSDGQRITVSADTILYAKWTALPTYKVTFNANGGTGIMTQQTFTQGVAQNLQLNSFKRAGYEFDGWAMSASGAAVYFNGQQVTISSSKTLYAVWKSLPTYKVTFNANGGTGTMADQVFTQGVSQALRASAFTFNKHTFMGWSRTPDGDVDYVDRQQVVFASDTTLYAIWRADAVYEPVWTVDENGKLTKVELNGATEIAIPSSVRIIGNSVFYRADITSVVIPSSVTNIEAYAFNNCNSLTTVTFSDGVKEIGGGAFFYCTALGEIDIPDSVLVLGNFVFENCTSLSRVKLGSGLKEMGIGMFSWCKNLASVIFMGDAPRFWYSESGDTYRGTPADLITYVQPGSKGWLGTEQSGLPETWPIGSSYARPIRYADGSSSIGEPVWTVDEFGTLTAVDLNGNQDVSIPSTVRMIGEDAFAKLAVASVVIPETVTNISYRAFDACTSLTNVIMRGGIILRNLAFRNCTALQNVELAPNLTFIGGWAFQNCKSLTKIDMPDSVRLISYRVFENCNSLKEVVFGKGLQFLCCEYTFDYCRNLETVRFKGDAPKLGSHAGYENFFLHEASSTNLFYDTASKLKVYVPRNSTGWRGNGLTGLPERWPTLVSYSYRNAPIEYWEDNSYIITYASGSYGTGLQQTDTKTKDVALTLKGAIFTRTGYTQTGWAKSDGGAKAYDLGVSYTANATMTLYPYWTANTYTVTFNANGGTGGWSRSMDYGATITAPTVSRVGFTFTGWAPAVAATVPAGNVSYTAQWKINQYTVMFDANGGTGGKTVTQNYGTALAAPTVTRTGYTFTGWSPAVPSTMPAANATYVAQWTKNKYTVTFNANGGNGGWSRSMDYGATITVPAVTRTGYSFTGWTPAVASTVPAGNVVYTAQWKINQYTVTFDANGGDGGKTVTLDFGAALAAPTVTRTGYTFAGWTPAVPATVPAGNATYVAQWTKNKYTVTFDVNGGVGGWSKSMDYGAAITAPAVTRTGYTFTGWTPAVAATVPVGGATYTAQWKVNQYTVTFNANGGEGGWSGTLEYGKTLTAPAVTREGHRFKGWSPAVPKTVPDADATYTAQWEANKYTVTFDANGGSGGWTRTLAYGSSLSAPTVTRKGYAFTGWSPAVAKTVPVGGATYTAQWSANAFTITFDANGGKGGWTRTLNGDAVLKPPSVTRDGYDFAGWTPAVPAKVPLADATYTAQWELKTYTIAFDANGGSGGGMSSELHAGDEIDRPDVGSNGSMVFAGWEPVPPAFAPASNAIYVAQWVAAEANTWQTKSVAGGVAIKGCSFPYGKVEIPAAVNGKKVVAIADYAFFGQRGITEVVISDSVESIGVKAFKGCSNLKKVTLPARLATLGQAAFQDCVSLTEMDVPALGDNYLWSSTFEGCTSLRRVSLPEGITAIGTSSFANCKALVEVNIPSTVKTIKSFAFFSCESLADVTLPTALVKIEQKAFKNCVSMTAVEIPSGVKTLGKAVFFNSGLVEATVPGGIAKVDDYCFQKCAALKKVTLSEGVKETGASVWANDGALEEVVFPKTLETLGGYAFFRCPSLATLWNFSSLSNLSSIGEKAFKHCTSLKTLALPSQVTSLPKEMCNYCASLETVTGTWNVTSIGQSAFSNCPKLKSVAGLDAAALETVKRGREWRR